MRRAAPAFAVAIGILAIVFLLALRAKIVNAQLASTGSTDSTWLAMLMLIAVLVLILLSVAAVIIWTSARVSAAAHTRFSDSLILLSTLRPDLRAKLEKVGAPTGEITGPIAFAFSGRSLTIVNRGGRTIACWNRNDVSARELTFDTGRAKLSGICLSVPYDEIAFVPRSGRPFFTRVRDIHGLVLRLNSHY
ncbi:hypothetical protein [Leifsonia sp. Leaf336]|uniref:hypothetical protein n=1 Tax=Leifsonia sp. Leaf336 TaxID=1736341 RepID=UPI000A6967C8|nr:hypothetical protein [Leifsonia sp. Leaf336]